MWEPSSDPLAVCPAFLGSARQLISGVPSSPFVRPSVGPSVQWGMGRQLLPPLVIYLLGCYCSLDCKPPSSVPCPLICRLVWLELWRNRISSLPGEQFTTVRCQQNSCDNELFAARRTTAFTCCSLSGEQRLSRAVRCQENTQLRSRAVHCLLFFTQWGLFWPGDGTIPRKYFLGICAGHLVCDKLSALITH